MNLYQKLSALHVALSAIPKYVKLNDAGEPAPVAWRFDYCGKFPMVWLQEPPQHGLFDNVTPLFASPQRVVVTNDMGSCPRPAREGRLV